MKNSRKEFLDSINTICDYWVKVSNDTKQAAQGVAFSILCLLDGVCVDNLYGYTVIDNGTGQRITDQSSELHADIEFSK